MSRNWDGKRDRPRIFLTSAAKVAAVRRGTAKLDTARCVGPGAVHAITRKPPAWVRRLLDDVGDRLAEPCGYVPSLMPTRAELARARKALRWAGAHPEPGEVAREVFAAYAGILERRWCNACEIRGGDDDAPIRRRPVYAPKQLAYGAMAVRNWRGRHAPPMWDGQRWAELGSVQPGDTLICVCGDGQMCHRRLAAAVLYAAGWSVCLDGDDNAGPDAVTYVEVQLARSLTWAREMCT